MFRGKWYATSCDVTIPSGLRWSAMPQRDDDRPRFSVIIMPSAHRQIAQASTWWRPNRPAVAQLFDDELDQSLMRLAENPGLGSRLQWSRLPDVHRLLVHRVGYVVFYRLRPRAQRIEVLAVWHARRGSGPRR